MKLRNCFKMVLSRGINLQKEWGHSWPVQQLELAAICGRAIGWMLFLLQGDCLFSQGHAGVLPGHRNPNAGLVTWKWLQNGTHFCQPGSDTWQEKLAFWSMWCSQKCWLSIHLVISSIQSKSLVTSWIGMSPINIDLSSRSFKHRTNGEQR